MILGEGVAWVNVGGEVERNEQRESFEGHGEVFRREERVKMGDERADAVWKNEESEMPMGRGGMSNLAARCSPSNSSFHAAMGWSKGGLGHGRRRRSMRVENVERHDRVFCEVWELTSRQSFRQLDAVGRIYRPRTGMSKIKSEE